MGPSYTTDIPKLGTKTLELYHQQEADLTESIMITRAKTTAPTSVSQRHLYISYTSTTVRDCIAKMRRIIESPNQKRESHYLHATLNNS